MNPIESTASLVKNPAKYLDWRAYFEGMWVNGVKAATGAFLAFAGTNTAEAVAPGALAHVGLDWRQAVAAAVSVLVIEVIRYINAKPLPDTKSVSQPPFPAPVPPSS